MEIKDGGREPLTVERVRELLRYDPNTGQLWWRKRRRGVNTAKRAGASHCLGYRVITVDGRSYKEHRVIWLCVHGQWPDQYIDHIDQNKSNNRIDNLREVTKSQNGFNRGTHSRSGLKGVRWHKASRKWHARISCEGREYSLGYFVCSAAASLAYQISADKIHGEYACSPTKLFVAPNVESSRSTTIEERGR